MDQTPRQVIEYASPLPSNSDERIAMGLGLFAASLLTVSAVFILCAFALRLAPIRPGVTMVMLLNHLALIGGGVGWGLSRHLRPNRAYHWCAWSNFLNWVVFAFVLPLSL
jgi:hypothetical protein